jgi:hypothetical protein
MLGPEVPAMTKGSFDRFVIAARRLRTPAALAAEPVDALSGVSAGDREALTAALGIRTVGDLAANRFVARAQAIAAEAAGLAHDRGPDPAWSAFLASAPLATYRANPTEFRLDFGPVYYRGRLDGTARVLLVGQDPAANELVGHRALVGASGQRVQGLLERIGVRRDYLMVNTFLYPVYGQFFGRLAALSQAGPILEFRNALFDRIAAENALEAVVTIGAAARDAVDRWPEAAGRFRRHVTHPSALDNVATLADWNAAVTALRAVVAPEVGVPPLEAPYGDDWTAADHTPIPRRDLPFGVPDWHGVGSRAERARLPDGATDPRRIVWTAP